MAVLPCTSSHLPSKMSITASATQNLTNCYPVIPSLSTFHELKQSPTADGMTQLSVLDHPWPTSFSAAVSKILDDVGIPNFLWGDLLNAWRGNPHVPMTCGFVVATEDLDRATLAIAAAGQPPCECKSILHQANPESLADLPVHFCVPERYRDMVLFLCPNDVLLNLIPLTSDHPNPAGLTFDRVMAPLRGPSSSNAFAGSGPQENHIVNALTAQSLVKAWLLLDELSPPNREGVGFQYAFLLPLMTMDQEAAHSYDFQSRSLQDVWERKHIGLDLRPETSNALNAAVRQEWQDRIVPNGSQP